MHPSFFLSSPISSSLPSSLPSSLCRLRLLLRQLDKGTLPSISDLKKTISYAADVLTGHLEGVPKHQRYLRLWLSLSSCDLLCSCVCSSDRLQDVGEKQVRAWLATTFTKQESVYEQPPFSKPPTFKTVVRAVIIGQHIDRYDIHTPVHLLKHIPCQFWKHISFHLWGSGQRKGRHKGSC